MLVSRISIGMVLFLLTLPGATAQDPVISPNARPAGTTSADPKGSGLAVVTELNKAMNAKKAKPNDKVACTVTMDLLEHGKVVVPRGAKVLGHITAATVRTRQRTDSLVTLAFERVLLKDGHEIPIHATIQALAAPMQSAAPAYDDSDPANQMAAPPSPGPNEWKQIRSTTFPGSRGPDSADAGGVPAADTTAPRRDGPSLGPLSQGVIGMRGISIGSASETSTIRSSRENVHLSGGTQLVLRVIFHNIKAATAEPVAGSKN